MANFTCISVISIQYISVHYNSTAKTCAKCGGELYQRVDDQPETVRNRLEVYAANTAPLIDYYRAKGLIKDVDSNGLSIDQVYDKIKEVLDTL